MSNYPAVISEGSFDKLAIMWPTKADADAEVVSVGYDKSKGTL
jgi:hypothetical protein